jgi:hypothetical protein
MLISMLWFEFYNDLIDREKYIGQDWDLERYYRQLSVWLFGLKTAEFVAIWSGLVDSQVCGYLE